MNKLYFAESRQDRSGFRDRCTVWAATPELAARLADEVLEGRIEHLYAIPPDNGLGLVTRFFDMTQWAVAVYGNEYTVR